jgi:hypothetical protein
MPVCRMTSIINGLLQHKADANWYHVSGTNNPADIEVRQLT